MTTTDALPSDLHGARPGPTPDLVVGLGASAGGIKALQQFFGRARTDIGAAYVVILHLSPDHDSRLAEVVQAATAMPVMQVTASTPLAANHVYVISPNRSLRLNDGLLQVADITSPEERRAPVDVFFRTLAESYGSRAVCVVLSGTGPNGSAGLKRVKEYAGLAIVQNPDEAEYGDMPRNSIATGLVDLVLPVAEIPDRVAEYAARLRDPAADALSLEGKDGEESLRELLAILRVRTGHDFSNYKRATLSRRIERRMAVLMQPTVADYTQAIQRHPDEAVALMRELLISVTNFFRDRDAFEALRRTVIPRLVDNRRATDQIRVWVPGCATGEEAYSIAMLLVEALDVNGERPAVQMFATDLDEHAIAQAREGAYTAAEVADVAEERLQRFFIKDGAGYRVRRELRELMLFAGHNLIKDPPFSYVDLISCRNVLIYLNRAVQERVIDTFHFALRPGGYLFLGLSESPESAEDLFVAVDKNARIYESRTVTNRKVLAAPEVFRGLTTPRIVPRISEPTPLERIAPADLHHRLLEQYAPPSIVVTEEHNVVHVSERATEYLRVTGGEPTRDLFRLIRPELRADLRTALSRAARERSNVEVQGVAPDEPNGRRLNLLVRPVLRDDDPQRGYFLILFEDAKASDPASERVQVATASEPLYRQLEDDLSAVKTQLRHTVEQYETQVEEAKASNEELQAVNEELRSGAEELETSREELQSVNEELTTVNQELKIKIEELRLANNDFQNLINSTAIGTVFLDRQLRIKMSTPRAAEIFNLLPTDIGRPLSDITTRLRHDTLDDDIRLVLERLQTIEREVQARDDRWYMMHVLPYRTLDDRIEGVVLTFQEITERRAAELRVRRSEERLRLLIESAVDYAIFTLSLDGRIDSWNRGAERLFGYSADEIIGQDGSVLFTVDDRAAGVPQEEIDRALADGRAEDERWHLRKDGSRFYCSGVTMRLGDQEPLGLAKIARDMTEPRQAADRLRSARNNLEHRVRERTGQLEAELSQHAAAEHHVTRLVRRLVTAQEDERARIARDLHDQMGQQLTALRLTLDRLQERCPPDDDELRRALALVQRIDAEIGFLAWELRPAVLDDLGLTVALPRYVAEWAEHYGIAAECRQTRLPKGTMEPETEVTYYRVAQEALNNIAKHAHASRVDLILEERDGIVSLVVEDDGIGFDVQETESTERGIGLAGMRERARLIGATLDIESTPAKGTTVYLRSQALQGTRKP